MALTVNGTAMKKCNVQGSRCKQINLNGMKIWTNLPDYLYNYGNQVTDVTGGWSKNSSLMTGDSLTTWPYDPKGNVYINASNILLEGNGDCGGVIINTGRAINFQEQGIDKLH